MKNPNKHIRIGFISAIEAQGLPAWQGEVPTDVDPIPTLYVLIGSQTKNRTATDKDGFEWDCSLTVDIHAIFPPGYSEVDVLDDAEEKVLNAINDDLDVEGFVVKEMSIFDSRDIEIKTTDATIVRRIITYSMWLNNVD